MHFKMKKSLLKNSVKIQKNRVKNISVKIFPPSSYLANRK